MSAAAAKLDNNYWWLLLAVALFVGTGVGWRDPWPADEPRFALIARDMVVSSGWLFPQVGGDLYHQKPPFYFWLLAAAYSITGSTRASFLIPSFLAACGTLVLVYDLARRLVSREAALAAALLLACTIQFIMAARGAQIDATLCFLVTLSLYGLLRHLLLGPAWGWYFVGGFAAGLGVITKGVGFLPLLILLPYPFLRARGFQPLPQFKGGARWALAAIAFLLGIAVWLVPMLIAVAKNPTPDLVAYRDGILFQQTVQRYTTAWHHVEPWYYFLLEVIPGLWLPSSLLLFWLVPSWRKALREKDARVWLPLAWTILTLVFFSASSGKRGIYILPALPALIWAAAPHLPELLRRRGVQRAGLLLAGLLIILGLAFVTMDALGHRSVARQITSFGFDPRVPLYIFIFGGITLWLVAWRWRPVLAWPAVLICLTLVWSFGITPQIDGRRSARDFVRRVMAEVPRDRQLGFAAAKEQFYLQADRPVVNFGHARWMERQSEAEDAARWLNAAPGRVLLAPRSLLEPCFARSPKKVVGRTSREEWSLIELPADAECASQGDPSHVIRYVPMR